MSDHYLQFIPTDAQYQPSPEAAERARILLATFTPEAEAVTAIFKASVDFFHPGSNGLELRCLACGADASYWWAAAMDTAWKSHLNNLNTTAHCCGAPVSLNDLKYDWAAGFGRFVLETRNPNISDLLPSQVALLQTLLGCNLRPNWLRL